jgi:hypothetical protein
MDFTELPYRRDHRQKLWQALNAADCLDKPVMSGGGQVYVSMLLCLCCGVPTADGRREFILPHGPIRAAERI